MTSRSKVPDAWDDEDWEAKADREVESPAKEEPEKLSKAERRARQAALNKKLWDEAEAPDAPYFVQRQDLVPLQSDYKPSVKVLSRRPTPTVIAKKDPVSGIEKLSIDDNDDDEEEDPSRPKPLTMEERQLKAKKEREEKQRKYEEVRERLFGSSSNPPSGSTTPGHVTPPRGGRGRGRGSKDSRSSSSSGARGKQLYDPNYNPKPNSTYVQRQQGSKGTDSPKAEDDPIIRQPKPPDNTGRGGFGCSGRGSRS